MVPSSVEQLASRDTSRELPAWEQCRASRTEKRLGDRSPSLVLVGRPCRDRTYDQRIKRFKYRRILACIGPPFPVDARKSPHALSRFVTVPGTLVGQEFGDSSPRSVMHRLAPDGIQCGSSKNPARRSVDVRRTSVSVVQTIAAVRSACLRRAYPGQVTYTRRRRARSAQ